MMCKIISDIVHYGITCDYVNMFVNIRLIVLKLICSGIVNFILPIGIIVITKENGVRYICYFIIDLYTNIYYRICLVCEL